MSNYSPPSDDDTDNETDGKKAKAKRAKKDPNAPKQPLVRVIDIFQPFILRPACSNFFFVNCRPECVHAVCKLY